MQNLRTTSQSKVQQLTIYDINGKLIRVIPNKDYNQQQVDTSDLIEGIYVIQVKTESKTYQSKFIKI